MHFDHDWREDVTLEDGTRARLRLIRPSDRDRLDEGFRHLSPETRFLRFFAVKDALSPAELAYLTEIDQRDHFAIGAAEMKDGEEGEGLGVARFVRLREQPDTAEAAVIVADRAQRRGLGRVLLQRLLAAAAERGVARFRAEVLVRNQAARALFEGLAQEAETKVDGDVLTVEWAVPPVPPDQALADAERHSPFYRLMALAAKQWVVVRQALFGEHEA